MYFTLFIALVWGLYACFNLILAYYWFQIPTIKLRTPNTIQEFPKAFLSVVIPVRNEAKHLPALLQSLLAQTYPTNKFEVWMVNDHSTDESVEIIKNFIQKHPNFPLHLLHLSSQNLISPKKQALELAIQHAQGELILTTDGDCVLPKEWLETINLFYQQTHSPLISSLVTFSAEKDLFQVLQTIEFASLVGAGAASMQAGFPTMCNGANLAYTKQIFARVNGFEGIKHLASGDDELLMRKIAKISPQNIRFLKSSQNIVHTQAQATWKAFFQQRKRWASKWHAYPDVFSKILAVFIFLSNALVPFAFFLTLAGIQSWHTFAWQIGLKCGSEYIFLCPVLWFLGKRKHIWAIPLLQIIYPYYVIFFGIIANLNTSYEWKNRKLA